MKQNAFHHVPERLFLIRMIFPGFVTFSFGLVLMGMIAAGPSFQRKPALAPGVDPDPSHLLEAIAPAPPVHPNVIRRASYHLGLVIWNYTHIPPACAVGGVTLNEVQKKHCEEFWDQQTMDTGLALLPFVLVLAALAIARDRLRKTYRRARKRYQRGDKVKVGNVTQPAEMPNDFFGWLHCCQAVSVQFPDKTQAKVYIPPSSGRPKPGESVAVVDCGKIMGSTRSLGLVFSPHVAVVRGS